jgi:hypothetical protein
MRALLLAAAFALLPATSAQAHAQAQAQAHAPTVAYAPISTQGPDWYDLDFHRQVLSSPNGVAAPAAVGLASPGIRPGQWLVTVTTNPIGFAWCSANFVFKNGSTYGLGTAGHCAAPDALGAYPDVTAYVVPPLGQGAPGFYHIGEFVLSSNNGVGDDFAMIELYPRFQSWVNPTMPVWGGPIGTYTSTAPTVVKHFGHGLVVGTGGTPRAGLAYDFTARGGDAFAWYGVGMVGDSGSGVVTALGQAAGNFTHIVVVDDEIVSGSLAGTTMKRIKELAGNWTLVDGSLLPVP